MSTTTDQIAKSLEETARVTVDQLMAAHGLAGLPDAHAIRLSMLSSYMSAVLTVTHQAEVLANGAPQVPLVVWARNVMTIAGMAIARMGDGVLLKQTKQDPERN
jgi:hypothetical protein